MAILPIRIYGDPVLRKKARPLPKVDRDMARLMDDMLETMYDAPGIGLAAPQIGMSERVIVVDIGGEVFTLANPRVLKAEGEQIGPEACLSVPGYQGIVARAEKIVITGLGRDNKARTVEAAGLMARCFLHEIDHLDGKIYMDRLIDSTVRRIVGEEIIAETGEELFHYEFIHKDEALLALKQEWEVSVAGDPRRVPRSGREGM